MEDRDIAPGIRLRKGKLGYRLVYPPMNPDGSYNWFNLLTGGSWGNLIKTLLLFTLIGVSCWTYYHDVTQAIEICNNVYAMQIRIPIV